MPKNTGITRRRPACCMSGTFLLAGCADVSVNLMLQNLQWHGACIQHGVVELIQGEPVAERLLRFLPEFDNLEFTDHVRASLPRIDDVSFNFAGLNAV